MAFLLCICFIVFISTSQGPGLSLPYSPSFVSGSSRGSRFFQFCLNYSWSEHLFGFRVPEIRISEADRSLSCR